MNTSMLVPSRQRRISVALYAAIAFLVLLWATMFSSVNGSLQAEIEAKSQLLDGMQRRAGSPIPGKEGTDAAQFTVISAPTETVAASTLQQYLLDRLEQAGGTVQRVQAETGRDAKSDGMRRITAEIVFDASSDALQHLLFDLETGTPFVFVDTLSAQPAPNSATKNVGTGSEVLRTSMLVSSYWSSHNTVVSK
jgi:general secretion pathway protein M